MRLPAEIAEPLRITRFDYDPHGNLLTRTQTATNDTTGAKGFDAPLTGSARAWHFTYNAFGQLKSETGPGAKVPSVTSYDYDGLGNLTQITSPLGHVTLLTNYDAHGRVGRVTEANGRVTDYHYSERGWLRDQQVSLGSSTESTGFSYSPAGQLTDVSFPNGSELHFVYDDAQRLTQVSDNNGNRIVYTLDLLGHRTAEQSYDVNGTLARNISRVFNTLGWVVARLTAIAHLATRRVITFGEEFARFPTLSSQFFVPQPRCHRSVDRIGIVAAAEKTGAYAPNR